MLISMKAISWFLRVFCYLFETGISLALLLFGGLALLGGAASMKLETIPWWQGTALNYWLVGLGIFGLLCVGLAILGKFRILIALWSLAVLVVLLRDVFVLPSVTFAGQSDFHDWLLITAGAAVAALGGMAALMRRRTT